MGLRARVYRSAGPDASCGGVSVNDVIVVVNLDGPFEPTASKRGDGEEPPVLLTEGPLGDPILVPAVKNDAGEYEPMKFDNLVGPMFGGRFAYATDGRFPGHTAIPIHDRFETVAQYERLSR